MSSLCFIFFLLSYFSSTPPDLFSITSSWFFLFSLLSLLLFYVSTRFCIILFSACILLRLQFLSPSNFLCFCLVDSFPLLLSSYFQLQFLFLHRVPWAVLVFFILLTFFSLPFQFLTSLSKSRSNLMLSFLPRFSKHSSILIF